jgi:hypothetical protein
MAEIEKAKRVMTRGLLERFADANMAAGDMLGGQSGEILMHRSFVIAFALGCSGLSSAAIGQAPGAARIAAQREAMAPLAKLDGVWRGAAWTQLPTGRHEVTHTERIGSFLDGSVKVLEGRAYDADGSAGFNAFGIISFDPSTHGYTLHSYALGYAGDFPLELKPDGYVWQIPAGPATTIRYTATITKSHWREIGERIVGDAAPVQMFEMNLTRIGDTTWPAADPVPMR